MERSEAFTALEEAQARWAEVIAQEVAERRFYDIKEVAVYAKVRLNMAIMEMVSIQVNDLEQQRSELVKVIVDKSVRGWKLKEAQDKLAVLTPKKKALNRLLCSLADYDEYRQLKNYVKEKFGQLVLEDFTSNYLNRPEFKINKHKTTNP